MDEEHLFELDPVPDPTPAQVREVYEHWRRVRRKKRKTYDTISAARYAKIKTRLADGYTVAELKEAIDNVALDPWSERHLHDDLTIIFRSRETLDRFLDLQYRPDARRKTGWRLVRGSHGQSYVPDPDGVDPLPGGMH